MTHKTFAAWIILLLTSIVITAALGVAVVALESAAITIVVAALSTAAVVAVPLWMARAHM